MTAYLLLESITGKNFNEHLEDLLNMLSLDNPFGYILVSVILMGLLSFVLALMKSPMNLILFANGIMILFLTALDWIPIWVVILIALLLLFIIFLKYFGGRSSEN